MSEIERLTNDLALANMAIERKDKLLNSYLESLIPSGETKAAYWGSDRLPNMNWTDMKTLMELIKERADDLAV